MFPSKQKSASIRVIRVAILKGISWGTVVIFLLGCTPQVQQTVEEVYVVSEDGVLITVTVVYPTVNPQFTPEAIPTGRALAEPPDPNLQGTSWRLVELESEPFPGHLTTTLTFDVNGVSGHDGCNKWNSVGDLVAANGRFSFPYVMSETGGCAYPNLTKKYALALTQQATTYHLKGNFLELRNDQGQVILLFENNLSRD